MPAAKEITVQTYESRYHDLGLYASQINIPVEKVWDDNNNQDGKRPESIQVQLYANGKAQGEPVVLNAAVRILFLLKYSFFYIDPEIFQWGRFLFHRQFSRLLQDCCQIRRRHSVRSVKNLYSQEALYRAFQRV